jgi:hypothetical protein
MAGVALALALAWCGPANAFFPMGGYDPFNLLRLAVWPINEFDTDNDGVIEPGEGLEVYIETGRSGFTAEEAAEVEEAMQVWEDVPTSYAAFRVGGYVQDPVPVGSEVDGRSMIAMFVSEADDTGEDVVPDPDASDVGGGILGVTITLFTVEDTVLTVAGQTIFIAAGTVIDRDIIISATDHRPIPGQAAPLVSLKSTVVHELGHFLGLDHTPLNNLRPIFVSPTSEVITGLVENEVIWLTGVDGEARFVGATPTMFPIYFQVEDSSGNRLDGGSDLAPDDISGISWLYPRGSQSNFFAINHEARSHTRRASGLPSIPLPGGHVVAWADSDNDPSTPRIPLFSTMTGLYEPFQNQQLVGRFRLVGMWKQMEVPGTQGALFNPTYAMTLNALNSTGFDRQAPDTALPEEFDSLQGPSSFSSSQRGAADYVANFPSEVFHEVENIVDISNKDAGTPLIWSFSANTVISSSTQRTIPSILPNNRPMFGDPNDVCPMNIIETGSGTTPTDTTTAGMTGPNRVRGFRDNVLLESTLGTAAVDLYYQASPAVARFLLRHQTAFGLFRAAAHAFYWTLENVRMITAILLAGLLSLGLLRRWRRARALAVGLALAALLWAGPAQARIAFLTTADLAARADAIQTGTVDSVQSYWASGGRIYTNVVMTIGKSIKGSLNEKAKLTISVLGGRVGALVMEADEMPKFEVGEKVLLYLRELSDGRIVVYAGVRGKFRIANEAGTGKEYVIAGDAISQAPLAEDAKAIAGKTGQDDAASKSPDGDKSVRIPLEDYVAYLKELVRAQESGGAQEP